MTPLLSTDGNTVILKALRHCGQQARQAVLGTSDIFEKGREDYVTTVDRILDRYLASLFAAHFPQDGIITEENQASASAFLANYRRLWCIDPIDGTRTFMKGGDHYAVMVGLLVDKQPKAGWVHAPAQGRMYWGGPGWGLFQQGEAGQTILLEPSQPDHSRSQVLLLGDRDRRRFGPALSQALPDVVFDSVGSFGLKVLEVIKGQAGLYVYLNGRVKLWDTTGPLALAVAAGLVCCDLDGNPIQFDSGSVYPQSLIHRQPFVIGWPDYVEQLRPVIRQAVTAVRTRELELCIPPHSDPAT